MHHQTTPVRRAARAAAGLTLLPALVVAGVVVLLARGVGTVGDNPGLESSVAVFIDGVYRSRSGVGLSGLGEIERIDDGSISITYRYLEGDEPNAAPQGRAESTFTWNDASHSVDHEGEFPPTA